MLTQPILPNITVTTNRCTSFLTVYISWICHQMIYCPSHSHMDKTNTSAFLTGAENAG